MTPRLVIIDTDTGVDDAMALMLAFRSPEIRVIGITTVAGNVEVHRCTRNVRVLLSQLGPTTWPQVIAGASRPLRLPLVTAPEVHGPGGLGRLTSRLAPRVRASGESAAKFLSEAAQFFGSDLTIVCLGPLTNLAMAVRHNARALRMVDRVISMGGAFSVPGNTGPVAEFNYHVDPHAARVVFNAGLPLSVVPLDVTERYILQWQRIADVSGTNGSLLRKMTRDYMAYHLETRGFRGAYLHDPLAVAESIRPGILAFKLAQISINVGDGAARGMTTASRCKSRRGVNIAVSVNRRIFQSLIEQRVLA